MTIRLPVCVLAAVAAVGTAGAAENFAAIRAEAEKLYAEGSYAQARDVYGRARGLTLPRADARWVDFRLADCLWRSQAASAQADDSKLEAARKQLEVLVRDLQRAEDKDRVWVEVQESLGDFQWNNRRRANWGGAWPFYQQALDWWAGYRDIDAARTRYLGIVWKCSRPAWAEPYYRYGQYGNQLPLEVVENAHTIAAAPGDKARAAYLLATTLESQGGWMHQRRVEKTYAEAITAGKAVDWYDDALYRFGLWLEHQGRPVQDDDGNWRREQDLKGALAVYRRILAEFKQGETRYYDEAKQRIENITRVEVGVAVPTIYLPDSPLEFLLVWRNTKRVDVAIHRVDLIPDVAFKSGKEAKSWLESIDLAAAEKVKAWSKDTGDKGDYKPGQERVTLEKLPVGAYVVEARSGDKSARDILLVTDVAVVLKTAANKALVYVCDALQGAPVPGAKVRLWQRYRENDQYHYDILDMTAGPEGLAMFEVRDRPGRENYFVAAAAGARQAYTEGYAGGHRPEGRPDWRIYAFTDRPAYRPAEKVLWKFIARVYDGQVYTTPAEKTLEYEITDPRGAKVKADTIKLSAFGSAWGELEVTDKMPLGEYRVQFWNEGRTDGHGQATLFRLEEYKLPEFKVAVQPPEENGRRKTFLPGEKIEVQVRADYYYGAPVANAECELIVRQRPFWHYWIEPREFPWLYEDQNPYRHHWRGEGSIIKRETVRTDAEGRAKLAFDAPEGGGQDYEYHVEARVTDASRREITGQGSVRVMRQRYFVHLTPEHWIWRPRDAVSVKVKALDANDQPVATEGRVKVTREFWHEVWIRPDGREVFGPALKEAMAGCPVWPPPPDRTGRWRIKSRGYERDEILATVVKTDTNGDAVISFTPEREGHYKIHWSSPQEGGPRIVSETIAWVADNKTTDLGFMQSGVQIIADKDTFRAGQKTPVMIVTPTADRHVLFSVEAEDLMSYQLVRVSGTVKLIQLDVGEEHVPNCWLKGLLVHDKRIHEDTKEIVVPPVKHFLTLDVKPRLEQLQPREEQEWEITARDHEGKPAAAEIAFGVADESVYYIQSELAGDPRQFYFGVRRGLQVQVQSTFNQKPYRFWDPEAEKRGRETVVVGTEFNDWDENGVQKSLEGAWGGGATRYAAQRRGGMVANFFAADAAAAMPATAAPMSAAEPMMEVGGRMLAKAAFGGKEKKDGGDRGPGAGPQVVVRSDFRATAFWRPDLVTDRNGQAVVKAKMPDSLTAWKCTARAVGAGSQFGIADATVRTRLPLIVRLQAPRFFVVGDEVIISAVINNNTEKPLTVTPVLEADGLETKSGKAADVVVPAGGETRVDWTAKVAKAGDVRLKTVAKSAKYADAMEKTYVAHEHGVEKFLARSGKVRAEKATLKLDLPKERKAGSTTMLVQIAPSLAVTMLDALPYLADYPYGCTEQTMSRFLPAVITAKTLKDLGLSADAVAGKVFGGVEPATADKTHSRPKADPAKLDEMVKVGLERLYDFQHGDGGWGWWKEGDSDRFMTAYVVWGLSMAKRAGVKVRDGVLDRAVGFLDVELVKEEENPDQQAWMLHALSEARVAGAGAGTKFHGKAMDNVWAKRDELNAYTRALLALAAKNYGQADRAQTLIRNLQNGVKEDKTPDVSIVQEGPQASQGAVMGTAHWGEDGLWWRWSDGGVEATAFALKALVAVDPKNPLIEPVMNWLVKNRRGAQWSNTRDTAICVLALNDYLLATRELAPELEYTLAVNGREVARRKVGAAEALSAPSVFEIDPALIRDGVNEVRVERKGGGALYLSAQARFFSLECPVTPAGTEIFVRRQYFKYEGRPTLLKGYVYDRRPLRDGETVTSGDRVETVITIEGKNNYEYLVFEDLKPAGFEATEVRSGEPLYAKQLKAPGAEHKMGEAGKVGLQAPGEAVDQVDYTGGQRWVYRELRDRKVALFLDKLPEGYWEIRYEMRAEVPGAFHALPVLGHAMYVPEIRCNGSELRVTVADKK